ncbi:carbon storage regulator [Kineobactrum sediminis]|uniref:Translational regulator CsrA n=1 Tax=Kineobactrum sediminis TaxID=1905677 RepID=A0A2N5Y4L5_9GAMM|nr:carbon storage regulator [Kineobactrum sediminis]PLW83321.1 carbon storage regulator [Kineobactrum sediminis]
MLILTRSPGQTLLIGDDIVVEVLAVNGDHVKLGLTAPEHIPLLRAELTERSAGPEVSTAPGRNHAP